MTGPASREPRHIRKKAWKPKTRTGCQTCRVRRVKCDEEKPYCKRCTSTGRKCDGYSANTIAAQMQELMQYPLKTSSLSSSMKNLQLDSTQEQEAFHFYQYCSVGEISGFYDRRFWGVDLLQAAQGLPAIRHALISLASMHRKFIAGRLPVVPDDSSDRDLRFALQQSNRAIQELLRSPVRSTIADKMNTMTCCLLFHCIACIQGHQSMALEHLRSGMKILREIDEELVAGNQDPDDQPVSLRTLRSMFVDMDIQARGIMSDKQQAEWEPLPKRDLAVSRRPFGNYQDARLYIDATYGKLLYFIQSVVKNRPKSVEDIQAIVLKLTEIREQFDTGTVLLENFLRDAPKKTRQDEEAILSIKLLHKQIEIILTTKPKFDANNNISADVDEEKEEEHIESLLDLASQLLHAPLEHTLAPESIPEDYYPSLKAHDRSLTARPVLTNPVFSSGSGVLTALWLVAGRAGNPNLRRRAIAMMIDCPRREGVWDSVMAGRIAWESMRFEETGWNGAFDESAEPSRSSQGQSPETTPRSRLDKPDRVKDINIDYLGSRIARVEFRSTRHYEAGEKGVYKYMSW